VAAGMKHWRAEPALRGKAAGVKFWRRHYTSSISPDRCTEVIRWLARWFGARKKHPLLLENQRYFSGFDQNLPIESYDFVCFDTELTGLNPRRDEIVSIGAVRIRNLRIAVGENFFAYVHPAQSLPKVSTLVHRITPQQIKDAPGLESVLPDFVHFCSGSILIGHFVSLDLAFVNKALRKYLGGNLSNPAVDSMTMAQVYHEDSKMRRPGRSKAGMSFNLGNLAKEYDLPMFEQHDALEDALQTAYLFLFLVRRLREVGYITFKDFCLAGRYDPNVFV
jgi:DNA polymerase III subunit epsilon